MGSSLAIVRPERDSCALAARNVWMRFGSTVALRDVSLEVKPATIHALVGENGAGKSTFLGIAAGRVDRSAGELTIFGRQVERADPRAARELGVAAIYQELTLVPAMSAVANVFLGTEVTRGRRLEKRAMRRRFLELREQLGVEIDPAALPRDLSVGDQQTLEIMRGLQSDARLLLLDEPTSALGRTERERLFETLRALKQRGLTAIFVSHDLGDVLQLADVITVFRDGQVVSTRPTGDWNRGALVRAMLGGTHLAEAGEGAEQAGIGAKTSLRVTGVSAGRVRDVSFEVRRGEILGIGGLVGSGRSTLLRSIAGDLGKFAHGMLEIGDRKVALPKTPARAAQLGIALIPENRKTHGLVLGMSALENVMLPQYRGFPLARVSRRLGERQARAACERVGFDPAKLPVRAGYLSGGNQQKLLLARWISDKRVRVLLADEPTRGVDVGAKADILQTLRLLADDGLSIIVASSELEDLEAIADRVVVMANGRAVEVLERNKREITSGRILSAAFEA